MLRAMIRCLIPLGVFRLAAPNRADLRAALPASGKAVEARLRRTLTGQAKLRYFGKQPVRSMAYLIAHEAHHQGQFALTLKLNGM